MGFSSVGWSSWRAWSWARRSGDDERRAPDRERGAVGLTGPVDHGVPVVRRAPSPRQPENSTPPRVGSNPGRRRDLPLGWRGAPDAPRGARARRPADRRPHRGPPRPHLHRRLRRRGDDLLPLHAAGGLDASSSSPARTDVTLDGKPAPYADGRIALTDLRRDNEVRVTARMPYVTDGDGMTVTIDPADGERYVCAHTSMDITQKVIPCFDQPDIKSTFAADRDRAVALDRARQRPAGARAERGRGGRTPGPSGRPRRSRPTSSPSSADRGCR